ncbi:hypothetical protein CC78DRAFT_83904 [Lojkania enalia]|uniref:GST N-terminal domain-containing protein n=1 Tax=Lojkania enalia TaxID=147567 RepID=A0A9P4K0H3_9PLEO|nr:hypothetical protein CC78DRAFT_83904 [Didymosphaeria enalia]
MKLFVTLTSPFARKCRVTVSALGLSPLVSIHTIDPWTDESIRTLNPLAKVPTLLRDDGSSLYDSDVIVEYLHSFPSQRTLIPQAGEERWRALRLQAMTDDACAAVGRLYVAENNPASLDSWALGKRRLRTAVHSVLDRLENENLNSKSWDLGDLCSALLPSYYSLRFPDRDWRTGRPRLSKFVNEMEGLPSFQANQFQHQ